MSSELIRKTLVAIANVPRKDGTIFTLEALQEFATKYPDRYVLEGDKLYHLLLVIDIKK